ncbi:MAG: ABC transporter ATP-binding protein [Cyanobacteria bacterium J06634_6]
MPPSAPVLSCQNITKRFGVSQTPAVNQVSFTLSEGELLGLLGPSGCGKTTLLRLVAGFEQPESGDITLANQQVFCAGHCVPPERRQVGVVFQDYALFPHLNVEDNVSFGLKQLSRRGQLPKQQIRILTREAINLVGLSGMEARYAHELSGGQQQRVALARALAPKPPLILLDEPFSNLDVQVRLYLRQEVRDILKSIGASGIFVTHDQEEALSIADKVAVMQNGHLVQLDPPEDIYQQPASRFIAEFVTQANFVSASWQLGKWETELGPIPDVHLYDQIDSGELMIRQEDICLEKDATGELTIRGRQFLGREYQYLIELPSSRTLKVRTAASQRFDIGDCVCVQIDPERVRLFTDSGDAIARQQKSLQAKTV